jgi:hypothetical protein
MTDSFSFFFNDWLSGTSHMSYEQKGVYIDLLCKQAEKGFITNAVAISICKTDELKEVVLKDKFIFEQGGGWYNKKLRNVLGIMPASKVKKRPARRVFVKPTADMVESYRKLIGARNFTGQDFIDHYETVGWNVGKSPMKDWKAAVRTWLRRERAKSVQTNISKPRSMREQIEEQKKAQF